MKGVDAIAQVLKAEGVEYLFSYPNNPIIDSSAKIGIRPIIARGEKTLINIADGYARATNGQKPTVIVVQAGPGIENAFGGLAQAYADKIPVMIIPGGVDQRYGGGEFDPIPPFSHITKSATRIGDVTRVPEQMRRAFSLLRNGPPAPVLLEAPRNVITGDIDDAAVAAYKPPRRARSAADGADLAEAARLLAGARNPLVLAGHGVLWAEAWDELRELAELAQLPVMTTMAAKSAFPEDHSLALGTGGHTLNRAAATFMVKSDVILAVGSGMVQRSGFVAPLPPGKTVIQITVDPRDLDKEYPTEVALIGDAKLVLRQLIDELRRQSGRQNGHRSSVAAEIQSAREAEKREWGARQGSSERPISPHRVIADLNASIDRANAIVTHDSGNPRDQTLTFYQAISPRGYLGWGKSTQLGTGYGLALGAKLAHPDKLVINVMGDLAFGTAGMEVETAVREKIAIMTVLLNNSVMGGYGHHMPSASEKFGSNRLSGSYHKVAEGLGAYAERVEDPGDVVAAIKRGAAATREGLPVLLEFITREEPVYPVTGALLQEVSKELAAAR